MNDSQQDADKTHSVGKFRIEKEIGHGPIGIVYRAVCTQSQQTVLLKVLTGGSDQEKANFINEINAAEILQHSGILHIHEAQKQQRTYYIAMQWVEGTISLKEHRSLQTLSSRQALQLIRDIASVLKYAHNRGIIHRNIKPNNILLDAQGKYYIGDFGIPKYALRRKAPQPYIAPELLANAPPSPTQDVYSLGVILYELLAERLPVFGYNATGLLSKLNRLWFWNNKSSPKIAHDVETICEKAMEKNPRRRYQSVVAFAEDIDRVLECQAITATPPGFWRFFYKKISHYQGVAIATTLSILVAILIAIYSIMVYPEVQRRKELQQSKKLAQQTYDQISRQYYQKLAAFSGTIDVVGLSNESLQTEKRILQKIRDKTQQEYCDALITNVLPLYRKSHELSSGQNEKESLIKLLQKIIAISEENNSRTLRVELSQLLDYASPKPNTPGPVLLNISPAKSKIYLHKFVYTRDGRKRLYPVAANNRIIAFTLQQKRQLAAREQFLQCQHLLWEAALQMFDQNFLVAAYSLLRAIEINPDYMDAYFLLCCFDKSSLGTKFSSEFWRTRALERIRNANISPESKKQLRQLFSIQHIQKIAALYSILPQRKFRSKIDYLLQIATLPNIKTPLQVDDYLLAVDNKPITSMASFLQALNDRAQVICKVLRNKEVEHFTLKSAIVKDPLFRVHERPPILFIWDNTPLNFAQHYSIYTLMATTANRIVSQKISLTPGDYLLWIRADGYFPVRYPFRVYANISGSPPVCRIKLQMLKLPQSLQNYFRDFVFIPQNFITGSHEHQNTKGYIIGRYEVTIAQWIAYLKAINGPLPWKAEKIKNYLPASADSPFLQIRSRQLVLQCRKTCAVCGVNYVQIQQYIKWLNSTLPPMLKKIGFQFRLPSSEEWQVAAQGADHRIYPWGDYANPRFCQNQAARIYRMYQEPVAKYNPAFLNDESPFGTNDMGGSVMETTSSTKYSATNYLYAVKGSGWNDDKLVDIHHTRYSSALKTNATTGFRICAGIDPLYGR